ncbi:protein shifted-like [Musca vetustissima]|uniref:protein shifted-like n=1 Tax=Musca vetustissima TaxID=27455 RepID=UPI002AB7148D|nr:protein shifted-like [Musca vetustissima]
MKAAATAMRRSNNKSKDFVTMSASAVWFVYLMLILMHCLWIDGIEARQQQHGDKQINEAGHHRRRSGVDVGGGAAGRRVKNIDSSSPYEVYPHKKNNRNRDNVSHRNAFGPNGMDDGDGGLGIDNGGDRGRGGGHGHGNKRRNRLNENRPEHQRKHRHRKRNRSNSPKDNLSLWINEQQLKMLTGYIQDRVYAIHNGHVMNDIRDGRIYEYLIIPPEVNHVNFTWKSGPAKYFYHFDLLESMDENILKAPTVSIKIKGRIPKEEKNFSVFLPCSGNNSGTAMFNVGLTIHNGNNVTLPGTPIRLHFKKECAHRGVYDNPDTTNPTQNTSLQGPDPECHLKCGEHGFCNHRNICQCHSGYIGQYCEKAFCFPQCMNGGNCTAPSVCTCPDGYQGTQCEGGICSQKCLNGGKCVQKDKCECRRGYYGLRCEISKCEISCMHGGRCIGTNLCRCAEGLSGNHCEIGRRLRTNCKRKCKHGECMPNKTCKCKEGYYGRYCNQRVKKH